MILKQIPLGPMQNFGYVLGCEQTKEAAIVDPGFEHEKLLETVEGLGLRLTTIIITHSHFDHIQELPQLYQKTSARVVIGEKDPYPTDDFAQVLRVQDQDTFTVGNLNIQCFFTPGHHPGETCYVIDHHFLTGDMLFVGGCGRVDLPGSNPEHMWSSLEKLKKLPDDWIVYPGHDYGNTPTSTLKQEKVSNHFLACKTREEFFSQRGV